MQTERQLQFIQLIRISTFEETQRITIFGLFKRYTKDNYNLTIFAWFFSSFYTDYNRNALFWEMNNKFKINWIFMPSRSLGWCGEDCLPIWQEEHLACEDAIQCGLNNGTRRRYALLSKR